MAAIISERPRRPEYEFRDHALSSPSSSSSSSASLIEKTQTRPVSADKQEWVQKYEYNLKRVYKYLTQWKDQTGFFNQSHNPLSFFPSSRSKSKSKGRNSSATAQNEKMGVSQSTAKGRIYQGENGMPYLPLEVHIEILQYLDWREQVRLTRVCKTWRAVITEWVIPRSFRTINPDLGPYIINPLFAQLECELGFGINQTGDIYTGDGTLLIDQPLCWPPANNLIVRISDLRTDGLQPGIDERINIVSNRCCDRNIRIRDLLATLDRFYRQVNEDRAITDEASWTTWKFRLETNRWWRRGYLLLHGKWEWRDGGRYLCLYAKKVEGAWEADKSSP
ncbi:hypothetical protein ABW19_dt0203470 [Dactylella cylindrospora]|nr:hypothetical protein ABW19_dt0203470 [Dactylella cylindrospora]